jgi:hypothetical protein
VSALIGKVQGPYSESPRVVAEVWCSPGSVELGVDFDEVAAHERSLNLDPIAARNLAALLVRASEEAERMASRTPN